jgi:hypothetical protein
MEHDASYEECGGKELNMEPTKLEIGPEREPGRMHVNLWIDSYDGVTLARQVPKA